MDYTPQFTKKNDEKEALTVDTIAQHLGSDKAKWADSAATHWSCIDGRATDNVFGTPGGDYSEFLMGLSVLEKLANVTLTEEQVNTIFATWLDTISVERRFYMHTDNFSTKNLMDKLGLPAETDITRLPAEKVEEALTLVTEAPFIGCGHVKFGLLFANEYGMSAELPKYLIRAFYKQLWSNSDKLWLSIAIGPHDEKAVILVKECPTLPGKPSTFAPMLAPTIAEPGAVSVFVAHPAYVHVGIRQPVAAFIHKQLKESYAEASESLTEAAVLEKLDELANVQLGQTVPRLAAGMPIYELDLQVSNPRGSVL